MGFLAMKISGHIPIKAIFTGLNGPCSMGTNMILNNTSIVVANTLSENNTFIFSTLNILYYFLLFFIQHFLDSFQESVSI